MQPTLLTTKLFAPPPRQPRVHRPVLDALLSKALTHPLTLVSAPAGYGKTTLVSSWLQNTAVPSTWLSLDEGDNDPITFLQYFLTALQKVMPAIHLDLLDRLQGPQAPAGEVLVTLLVNEITEHSAALPMEIVAVLDDFHSLNAQPSLEMIAAFLERMPPSLHVILLSRSDPVLPLSRLRARNQLVEIRAEQLRFNSEEISLFFHEVMGLALPDADVEVLEARTEGWVAGLQLAALSMQGCAEPHGFVSAFTGSHTYIMDYLVDEVLKQQPENLRSFYYAPRSSTACADRCARLSVL